MAAEFFLARRYLLNHREGAWGWLIGWLATGSVALGVASLIVTLSVMTGFREDIRKKILGVQPHILLTSFTSSMDYDPAKVDPILQAEKKIDHWTPYVMGQALIGRGSQTSGLVVKGIDPEREAQVSQVDTKVIQGSWDDLKQVAASDSKAKPKILLGQELARNIGARQGDTVWLVTSGSIGLAAMTLPKAHTFEVGGLIQSGLYDYDSSLAFMALPQSQKLFDMGSKISGIGIKVKDLDQADALARELQVKFEGAYWIRSWLSLNRNLFSALKLEKTVMFIILIMVTLVASVMIVSNLLLSISQKTKEIGILRAIGATSQTIHRIFLYQGLIMGAVGTAIGTVLGIGVSLVLAKTNLIRLPADVYYIDHLPVRIDLSDILLVVCVAAVIVLLATLYPARRATKVDPLEAIRYG